MHRKLALLLLALALAATAQETVEGEQGQEAAEGGQGPLNYCYEHTDATSCNNDPDCEWYFESCDGKEAQAEFRKKNEEEKRESEEADQKEKERLMKMTEGEVVDEYCRGMEQERCMAEPYCGWSNETQSCGCAICEDGKIIDLCFYFDNMNTEDVGAMKGCIAPSCEQDRDNMEKCLRILVEKGWEVPACRHQACECWGGTVEDWGCKMEKNCSDSMCECWATKVKDQPSLSCLAQEEMCQLSGYGSMLKDHPECTAILGCLHNMSSYYHEDCRDSNSTDWNHCTAQEKEVICPSGEVFTKAYTAEETFGYKYIPIRNGVEVPTNTTDTKERSGAVGGTDETKDGDSNGIPVWAFVLGTIGIAVVLGGLVFFAIVRRSRRQADSFLMSEEHTKEAEQDP